MKNYEITDAVVGVIEHALTLQQTAASTLNDVRRSQKALEGLSESISEEVLFALNQSLVHASANVNEAMSGRLERAIAGAERAIESMEKSTGRLSLKAATWIVCTAIVALGALWLTAFFIGVLPWQMAGMRDERRQLQEVGADAQMSTCREPTGRTHLCIRIDPKQPGYQDGYWVIQGH